MGNLVKVKMTGGPKDGKWLTYHTPLPKVIVVTEVSSTSMKYHDYERVGTREYKYKEPSEVRS